MVNKFIRLLGGYTLEDIQKAKEDTRAEAKKDMEQLELLNTKIRTIFFYTCDDLHKMGTSIDIEENKTLYFENIAIIGKTIGRLRFIIATKGAYEKNYDLLSELIHICLKDYIDKLYFNEPIKKSNMESYCNELIETIKQSLVSEPINTELLKKESYRDKISEINNPVKEIA